MNTIKVYFLSLLFILGMIILPACSDDDDEKQCNDQVLSGTIENKAFAFANGRAEIGNEETDFNFFNSDETLPADICDLWSGESIYVFGTVSLTDVGRVDLFIDLNNGTGETLTLYTPEGSINDIATEGYLEITAKTDTEISGSLHAKATDSEVCGTFYC